MIPGEGRQRERLSERVSRLLEEYRGGDAGALDRLMPLVYDELRRVAARALRAEHAPATLGPSDLVHEAYVRMVDRKTVAWQNRAHFLACAALAMRNILVDRARARLADKRWGRRERVALSAAELVGDGVDLDLVALDDALKALAEIDPQKARVVELRYFGGLSVDETAEVMGVSDRTVKRAWTMSRAWLRREMLRGGGR
jgi:RNA polymerase sigma factor (TIGR02999 family)